MAGSAGVHGRARVLVVVWAVLALITACAAPNATDPGDDEIAADLTTPPLATTRVGHGDLTTVEEHVGQLGYGEALPVVAGRDGTVTALPAPGSILTLGQPLAEINGIPTQLLHGVRPVWRTLAVSDWASDDGPDIHQLNDNLAALGYAVRDQLPDARFDWRTREAVRLWQTDLGRLATGRLELGDVAFLPGDVRVGAAAVRLGTLVHAGEVLLTVTGTEQVVSVALPATDRGTVSEGLPVVVVLLDRTSVQATVRSIGHVATAAEEGARPTVAVAVALAQPVTDGLDAAPVQVQIPRVLASDVLTVPVGALVATAGNGYAVERVIAGGTELVAVEPGEFADGLVAIDGPVDEGDEVVVPS
ncbi:MAG TPA: peptidoglycan-binding protein [Euzebya sp.]|nr:peptidoglycan-binding protein [Euzebya sp.]